MKVTVDKELCIGCAACVSVCPQGVFELDKQGKANVINQEACINCQACEETCPVGAIKVKTEK